MTRSFMSGFIRQGTGYSHIRAILCVSIQWTWGILQNLIGFAMFLANRSKKHYMFKSNIVTEWNKPHSMGCGMFIFLSNNRRHYDRTIDEKLKHDTLVHEYGHTVQSLLLGPLFLPVIAIPSVTWAFFKPLQKLRKEKRISYYWLYCEKWANHLGDRICGNRRLV